MSLCFLPVTGKQPILLTLDLCVLHVKVELLRGLTHRVAAVGVTGWVIGRPLVRLSEWVCHVKIEPIRFLPSQRAQSRLAPCWCKLQVCSIALSECVQV